MAKRFKNFRDGSFDEWEDVRKEDRLHEKSKNARRQSKRRTRIKEKYKNFKDFTDE